MRFKKLIFANRSYTPIPIAFFMIFFSAFNFPFYIIGAILVLMGETIRINAVGYAGGATRTLKVGAPSLCSSGPYAFTRNPLYLGNMLIYLGFVLFSGGTYLIELFLFVFFYFTFQYFMIISLEEKVLYGKFKGAYSEYIQNVPRLFPRLNRWENKDDRKPMNFKKIIKTEKRSLQNIILIALLIIIKNIYV
tara:strand:- start:1080 stop:1655 length:576 start_codon:yes stop_codon:yes gene_type:complete